MNNFLNKRIESEKVITIIVIIICCIAIMPLLYLAIYSRPCVDDYCYSAQTHNLVMEKGFNLISLIKEAIKVDIHFYNTWQGLYSSAFILSLQPGIFGEQYYFIGVWLLILFMFGCLYFFIKTIFKDILKIKKYTLLITTVSLTTVLAGLRSPVEGLYWFNGAWNYMPFLFLNLVNIAFLLRVLYLNKKVNIAYSVILSFIISGGNHVTSFLNIMILTIYSIVTFKKSKAGIISLISAIIGFIIMYIAPGTSIRQAELNNQGIMETILISIRGYAYFIENTISVQWIFIFLSLVLLSYCIKKANVLKKEKLKWNPILLYIIKAIIICGLLCVPYKAMGSFGAGRVSNVIWCAYIILNCIFYIYTILWISFRIKIKLETKFNFYNIKEIALIIIITGMIFFPHCNTINAIKDITSGNAQNFANACDERYKMMRETRRRYNLCRYIAKR